MSDERMMTMDEDEEIGQVRFVDVLYIYVFSVSLSLLIAEMAEMITSYHRHHHCWWFLPRVVV